MAGQSSHLSLKEATAMQERVQASGSHATTHGSKSSSGDTTHRKKKGMKEEC